jgi:glyoxylase-like metal-dependent hydrolase (beta-lactamase superfamily II)
VTDDGPRYEAYALRYGTRPSTKSKELFRFDLLGGEDAPQQMDYYFWLLRDGARTILVDCGFDADRGRARGRHQDADPVELLAALDVRPEDVDQVVISHMHYDHVGNLDLFPDATVTMTRREYEFWSGPYGDRPLMQALVIPEELAMVQRLRAEGRLVCVDDVAEIAPGITVTAVGGHTPGQAIVEAPVRSGRVVLASDAIHYYEQLERDWPFRIFTDVEESYRSFDILRDLQARSGTAVVAGHDPRVGELFDSVSPTCVDLAEGPLFGATSVS